MRQSERERHTHVHTHTHTHTHTCTHTHTHTQSAHTPKNNLTREQATKTPPHTFLGHGLHGSLDIPVGGQQHLLRLILAHIREHIAEAGDLVVKEKTEASRRSSHVEQSVCVCE